MGYYHIYLGVIRLIQNKIHVQIRKIFLLQISRFDLSRILDRITTPFIHPYQALYYKNMGDNIPSESKRLDTGLTGYSISNNDKTGPYADTLEIDALVVGAGFGTKKYWLPIRLR